MPLSMIVALVWFLVRVIPKPSRIAYPCQQVAVSTIILPIAGFLASMFAATALLQRAVDLVRRRAFPVAIATVLLALTAVVSMVSFSPEPASASVSPVENDGYAHKTVVRVYDAAATAAYTFGDSYYWRTFDGARVQQMLEKGIMELTNQATVSAAWSVILPGASSSSKVAVKVNFNNTGRDWQSWALNNSPTMMIALTKSLNSAGIQNANITFFDCSRSFPTEMKSDVLAQCPGVQLKGDAQTGSSTTIALSCGGGLQIPQLVMDANYLISLHLMKKHDDGITGAIKNLTGMKSDGRAGDINHCDNGWSGTDELKRIIMHTAVRSRLKLCINEALLGSKSPDGLEQFDYPDMFPNGKPSSIFVSRNPFFQDIVELDFVNALCRNASGCRSSADDGVQWAYTLAGSVSAWNSSVIKSGTVVNGGPGMPAKDMRYDASVLEFVSVPLGSVQQTLTSVSISPASATVMPGQTKQFTATALDQYGTAMSATFSWTVSGGGSISTSGLFTAGSSTGGPHTVTAATGGKNATASVTVSASIPTDVTEGGTGTITAQSDNAPGEGVANLIDNSAATKWLDFADASSSTRSSWIQYTFNGAARYAVSSYALTAASDASERDPYTWALLGSNDGGATWATLDTRTAQTFSLRGEVRTFSFTNAVGYNVYRLRIDRVANPSSANSVQLAEIELLGVFVPSTATGQSMSPRRAAQSYESRTTLVRPDGRVVCAGCSPANVAPGVLLRLSGTRGRTATLDGHAGPAGQ